MRCPKCGFISFDNLEACKKCRKPFGDIISELNGATHSAESPSFLNLDPLEEDGEPLFEQQEDAEGETPFFIEDEELFELEDGSEIDFVPDQESEPTAQLDQIELRNLKDEVMTDLDTLSGLSSKNEFTLDLDEQTDDRQAPAPLLDFGDLDLADLDPSVKKQAEPVEFKKNPSSSGIEGLTFEDLDFENSAAPPTSESDKPFSPSVKTGTALDTFNVDLGNLFTDKKK